MGKYNEDIIYHYCSVETFYKIIESKVLWLSNSDSMNDKLEGKWVDEIFEKIDISNNPSLPDSIKKRYKELNSKKQYIICFSANEDKPSQWEEYGNDGKGVAIGFSKSALGLSYIVNEVYDKEVLTVSSGFIQVIYSEAEQINLIEKILDSIDGNEKIDNRLLLIKELSNKFKGSLFEEEQEVRLVYIPKNYCDNEIFAQKLSGIKYRDNSIDYYEYKLTDQDKYENDLIPQIILGPECVLEEYDLQQFLHNNGLLKTEILKSISSYR